MKTIDRMADNIMAPSILVGPLIFDSDAPAMTNEIPCAKNMEMMYIMMFMWKPFFFLI